MGKVYEWESIDDSLFEECKVGDLVCVSDKPYMQEMEKQNKKVVAILTEKYPERKFRVSKWHPHDFGSYQEVEERMEYDDDDDEEFIKENS